MKNFKKVLALVLALSMVLSSMTAFAAEVDNTTEAEVLNSLGLFDGVNPDEFDPNLEGDVTKGDALIMMSRIFNWDVESTKGEEIPFTDVESWQVDAVTYAYVNGITVGDGGELLVQEMTSKQLVTLVLRELGYESAYAWDHAIELALAEDLLTATEVLAADEVAIRDNLVGVCYNSLTAVPQDAEATVLEALVEEGAVEEDAAVASGLMEEPAPEVFEVASVEPLSLVQTLVVFTADVDDDTVDADDFEFDGDEALDFEVKDDNKSIVVTHTEIENGAKVDVEIANIDDAEGTSVEDTELEDVYYLDKEFPEVVDVEVFGDREIRIVFSEMMESIISSTANKDLSDEFDSDGNFDTDLAEIEEDGFTVYKESGKKAGIKEVRRNPNDYNAVDITLSADLNDGETYTIKIDADVVDFAGYGMYDEVTVDVELITVAPEVVSYDVDSSTEVTLTFDRDITVADNAVANFYHTNSKNDVDVAPTADGTDLTLTFDEDDELPEGTAYIYLEEDSIEDLYGNAIGTIKVTIEREEDTTAPIVVDVEQVDGDDAENKYFKITLDEGDTSDSAEDEDIYTVTDEDGDEVDVRRATLNSDGDEITVELRDEVTGEITVVIDGLEDNEGNDMEKSEFTLEMSDEISPDLAATEVTYYTVDGDLVVNVAYEKEMAEDGEFSVTDESKYQFKKGTSNATLYDADSDIEDVDIELSDEGDVVTITIPNKDNDDFFNATTGLAANSGNWKLIIARVADASGNETKSLTEELAIAGGATSVKLVDDDKYESTTENWVRAISSTEIEIKIDGKVDVDADDFELYYGSDVASQKLDINVNDTYDDGDTVVTLELDDYDLNADGTVTINNTDYALVLDIADHGNTIDTVNEYDVPVETYDKLTVYDFIDPEFDEDATKDLVIATFDNTVTVTQGTEVALVTTGTSVTVGDTQNKQVVTHNSNTAVKYTLVFDEEVEFENALGLTDIKVEFDGDELKADVDYDVVSSSVNSVELYIYLATDVNDSAGRYYITVEDADFLGDRDGSEETVNYVEDFTFDFDIEVVDPTEATGLTVTATANGAVYDLSVDETLTQGNVFLYMIGSASDVPTVGEDVSTWNSLTGATANAGDYVIVVEAQVDSNTGIEEVVKAGVLEIQ
ncbi:Ig-like domain-containing protein [Vallitalea okinawensis]|uniref:Ig-like domain-containing protein n=1 Tax=Vallitalea okinawensis TaxID=2078660 RepID=UPI000CFDC51C|nr:Ig-like domain-containing protein [Vallitalea okinawensis]